MRTGKHTDEDFTMWHSQTYLPKSRSLLPREAWGEALLMPRLEESRLGEMYRRIMPDAVQQV